MAQTLFSSACEDSRVYLSFFFDTRLHGGVIAPKISVRHM